MYKYLKTISLCTIIFTFFLVIGIIFLINTINDPDFFWHLKTGEYITTNHIIPKTDIFTWYGIENNLPWYAHEWLSEVIMYKIYTLLNLKGFVYLSILSFTAVFFLLFYNNRQVFEKNLIVSTIWILPFILFTTTFFTPRPQSFSVVIITVTYIILRRFVENDTKLIYIIPILSMLLVNLHGGTSTTLFVLIIAFIITNIFNFKVGRIESVRLNNYKIKTLIKVFILSIITGLINPYGYKMLLYPFIVMGDSNLLDSINEWLSPNFHSTFGHFAFLLISLTITIMLSSKKKVKLQDFFITAIFFYLSLKYQRMLLYFSIIVTPILFEHIPNYLPKLKKSKFNYRLIFSIFTLVFMLLVTPIRIKSINSDILDIDEIYPTQAIEYIKKYNPKRLCNKYVWGGYLIWELHDYGIYPFIDGRADIFSDYNYKDCRKIQSSDSDFKPLLEKYDFDAFILSKENLIPLYLIDVDRWIKIYEDEVCVFIISKELYEGTSN